MKMTQRRMARPSLGGLMATRQGALLLAFLCALCAAGILVFALGQYRSNIKTVTPQATVLVATASIPKGTSGSVVAAHNLYKSTPIVASQLAPGAISDASQLTGKVAAADILPGQQLTLADFAGVTGVAGLLTPDQRAISLSISESPGNTDVLLPGDRVDVYADFASKSGNGQPFVVLLDTNIQVIKTTAAPTSGGSTGSSGSSSASKSGSGSSAPAASANTPNLTGSSLVLNVSSEQASDLVYAANNGTLYLTLRPDRGTTSPRPLTTLAAVVRDSVATVNSGGH
jgi:Flp pilus assembly protein CpaB